MNILITESSEHLGEAIIHELKNSTHSFFGIDVKPSEYTTFQGSLTDIKFVKDCMKNIDAVIHTATLHNPHVLTNGYQDFIDSKITGTLA